MGNNVLITSAQGPRQSIRWQFLQRISTDSGILQADSGEVRWVSLSLSLFTGSSQAAFNVDDEIRENIAIHIIVITYQITIIALFLVLLGDVLGCLREIFGPGT